LLHVEHAALGLDVQAARIEADALADQRHLGVARVAPGHVDEPRCARCRATDRVHERKVLLEQVVPHDRAYRCAVAAGQGARGLLQLARAHVVRRRVDEIAREGDAFDDAGEVVAVDIAGQFEVEVLLLLLAITGETIAAERKCQGSELRIMRRVCESVSPGRENAGEGPGAEQVLVGIFGRFEREQDPGQRALGRGEEKMAAGLGLETGGFDEGAGARIEAVAEFPPGRAVNEGYWNRAGGVAAGKKDWMHCRIVPDCVLLTRGKAAEKAKGARPTPIKIARNSRVNPALRLTLYCEGLVGAQRGRE